MKNSQTSARLAIVALALVFSLSAASESAGAVFVVDRNDDSAAASACTAAANDCSIRGAVAMADSLASDDTIVFDPAVFASNNVILLNGVLRVLGNGKLLIDGSGAKFITLNAQNLSGVGVLQIEAKADVTVSHLTITGGNRAFQNGGGIENKGTFLLSHSTVTANRGTAGGAIYNISGRLTVSNSTICFNQSTWGAIHSVGTTAVANITDSTICGNTANIGGGIYVSSGTVNIGNSIVANNVASTGPDVYRTVNSLGYNLFGNSSGMTVGGGTADQFNVDPFLDPAGLADNGGNTLTVALLAGSSALDKGNGFAADDQRGKPRPVDDPDSGDGPGNLADIGAFEFQPVIEDPDPDPVPVPGYDFGGFQRPIDPFGLNRARSGSSVPVKFSLNGFHGFDIFAEGSPASVEIVCETGEPYGDPSPLSMPGRRGLSYDESSDTYSFVWKTERDWRGTCRRLLVGLNDGSVHSADFSFR